MPIHVHEPEQKDYFFMIISHFAMRPGSSFTPTVELDSMGSAVTELVFTKHGGT